MTDTAIVPAADPRQAALLKAVGIDRLSPEQRELALHIAQRYELDLMLKHLVMIEGRPYITRDGLLHVAHRSGELDGIEVTEPTIVDGYWRSTCSVYRKDMSRPFTYPGRYPTEGGNKKFAPEMAVKVGEVMALRRAFDVAAPVLEERWDIPEGSETTVSASAEQPSLAERAAAKRAEVEAVAEPTDGLFTDDEAPPLRLTKPQFVARMKDAGVDPNHAATLRLVMFPDADADLDDTQRGTLWAALEAEKAAETLVPA